MIGSLHISITHYLAEVFKCEAGCRTVRCLDGCLGFLGDPVADGCKRTRAGPVADQDCFELGVPLAVACPHVDGWT
jgi:hypothetical protein